LSAGEEVGMAQNFFIVTDFISERADFLPVGEVLIRCLPVGARGRACQSPFEYLDQLAQEAGVRPLSEFISEESESYFGEGKATVTIGGLPTSLWFTAPEGLVTIRGLLAYLTTHTEAVAEVKRVISELRQCEDALLELGKKGVRWHLEDGSWW
jgi:hypothetical protein